MEERLYDLIFIARPATAEDDVKKVLSVIEHTVAEKGGKVEKAEHWGTRKLAYRVAKHREGMYYYQQIRTSHPELISELERRLRVQDAVIKYQTVRLDEDLKRQKKLGDRRDKRSARRPRRAAAPARGNPGTGSSRGGCARSGSRKLSAASKIWRTRNRRHRINVSKVSTVQVKGWKAWQTNRGNLQHRVARRPGVMAAVVTVAATVVAVRAAGMAVLGVKVDRADPVVPAGRVAASVNISARRKFASSASRRWISSTTSAPTFCRSSCRSAARFCRVA